MQTQILNTRTYTYSIMGTRTLTITDEAYERLAAHKEGKDSFSDVINKLTHKTSLFDLIGILNDKEADEMHNVSKKIRKDFEKRVQKTARQIR